MMNVKKGRRRMFKKKKTYEPLKYFSDTKIILLKNRQQIAFLQLFCIQVFVHYFLFNTYRIFSKTLKCIKRQCSLQQTTFGIAGNLWHHQILINPNIELPLLFPFLSLHYDLLFCRMAVSSDDRETLHKAISTSLVRFIEN